MELTRFLMDPMADTGPVGLEELVHRPQWMAWAACRDESTSTFFLERGGQTKRAKAVCAGCKVRPECLDYAMADEDLTGIWAGTSEKERRQLRRLAG